ncbi:MAG: NAD+ synthase [Planctomycetota bacterium]|jgi:NAD+ synthase
MKELAAAITGWIKDQVERAGTKGAVLGLSGGLDSAVVGALCARAVGDSALGVILPCESSAQDVEHAELVGKAIGIRTELVSLDGALVALEGALGESARNVRANLKPRLRMVALYHYANRLSYLVAGTGNRSEIMLGYFTKHGDGASDILPIGGLYKTQVRELARELGIPDEIIAKPPSAGLWEGQTDEAELGMSYEEIDRALEAIDTGRDERVDPELIERVRSLIERSAHKRALPPVFRPGNAEATADERR